MLQPGEPIPARAHVWTAPLQEPVELGAALAGEGLALLCFYKYDWSPG